MSDTNYLNLDSMTERQAWAAGALAQRFHQNGTLKNISEERNQDMAIFLKQNGYAPHEIEILTGHMNAATDKINAISADKYKELEDLLDSFIKEGQHQPPAPPQI